MSSGSMAEDIESLRKHLELESIPVLFGHSNGACIALRYAERYPSRVTKLILADAQIHDGPPNDSFEQWATRRKFEPEFGPALEALASARTKPPTTDEEFVQVLVKAGPYHFYEASAAAEYEKQCDLDETPARLWAFLTQSACESKPENPLPHVAEADLVTAQILIVWGKEDTMCSLVAANALAQAISGAELVIFDECGHISWVEPLDQFLSLLRKFLSK